MDEILEKRKKQYINNIDKLLGDFKAKKKEYYIKHLIMCWLTTIVNATISLILGLSFLENYEIQFKVIALICSSLLTILNSANIFLNYKNKFQQRTKTLVKLQILKRDFQMKQDIIDLDALNNYIIKLDTIMQDDLDDWIKNYPSDKKSIEEN